MEYTDNTASKLVLAFDAKRLFNNFTGLGNYSRTLVRNMQKFYSGYEYHLFTPKAVENKETAYFFDSKKFIIHTPKGWNPLWRTYGMSKEINSLKPDIFHGLSHEIPFGLNKEIKKVLTFHDLIYERFPEQFGWWDRNVYHHKYKSSVERSNHIIAISKSTAKDLKDLYHIPEQKISVVYQSCNEIFTSGAIYTPKPDILPENVRDYYLYVGSLIERKGVMEIIKAYTLLEEKFRKPIVLVGSGDNDYIFHLKEFIAHHQLQNQVYMLSHIKNVDLMAIYDQSFCLIYPSVYEGFGIPVIESLFRKKPVITSGTSSLPEAGGPGGFYVNPYKPDEIAEAIRRLHDRTLYQKLVMFGNEYVRHNFSSAETAHLLNTLYINLLS